MARITVEDCVDKFPSRFELVLVASQRARKLHSGDAPTVEKDNDKNTVIALREIADETISVDKMKSDLIESYQTVSISDEEEENLKIETDAENNEDVKENNDQNQLSNEENDSSKQIEEEIKELSKSEDDELKDSYEITENPQLEENNSSENDEQEIS